MSKFFRFLTITLSICFMFSISACLVEGEQNNNNNNNNNGEKKTGTEIIPKNKLPLLDESKYRLTFEDYFDLGEYDEEGELQEVLDTTKWKYQLGNGSEEGLYDWGNEELQNYRKENVTVENGVLNLTAKKGTNFAESRKEYSSGRITTKGIFSQTYGRFEARIKMPTGVGLWPAFWLMPEDSAYGEWPNSGEIDIVEAKGRVTNNVGGTIHFMRNNSSSYRYTNHSVTIYNWNTYAIEWTPEGFTWYCNGIPFSGNSNRNTPGALLPPSEWGGTVANNKPFDQPFYIILNLAVGGTFDGGKEPPAGFTSADMQVEYVRVYEIL